jgi:hypothetical protein
VNDLAIARRHAVADAAGRLGDDHVVPRSAAVRATASPDNARADDSILACQETLLRLCYGQP